ncbi:hypothetical protein B0H14DRAFT_3463320 [Mycena olivaceomarginata]|nr:hypothetical protein B0H14DRAFT_3463320 [Mycena olivaceomarginata]
MPPVFWRCQPRPCFHWEWGLVQSFALSLTSFVFFLHIIQLYAGFHGDFAARDPIDDIANCARASFCAHDPCVRNPPSRAPASVLGVAYRLDGTNGMLCSQGA